MLIRSKPLIILLMMGFAAFAADHAEAQLTTPYDEQLFELSRLLGAMAHLERVCEQSNRAAAEMVALLEAEEPDTLRRGLFVDAYNRGFRSVAVTHQTCNDASDALLTRLRDEGAAVATSIVQRYGSPGL